MRRRSPEAPARGTGTHQVAGAAKKQAKVLLRGQEDFPCLVYGCGERIQRPLWYCQPHHLMASRGLILGNRPVVASERLWLMATYFRRLLNEAQRDGVGLQEAQAKLWDLACHQLTTDAPFHDIQSHLPFEAFLEMRHEEYTWAGMVPELRSRLPFTVDKWHCSTPEHLQLTLSLQRDRKQVLGKTREDFIRELCLFLKQRAEEEVEIRISVHLPAISRAPGKKVLTAHGISDYYPQPNDIQNKEENPQWQQSPLPPTRRKPRRPPRQSSRRATGKTSP